MNYDFYIHTYKDDPTAVLDQISRYHPTAKVIVIPDEPRLKNKSTEWLTRWFDITRVHGSDIIIKVDPDSTVCGPFIETLPNADFFGKIISYNNGRGVEHCIHGGYGQCLSKRFIDMIYNTIPTVKYEDFAYRNNLLSSDKLLAHLALTNHIKLINYNTNISHK